MAGNSNSGRKPSALKARTLLTLAVSGVSAHALAEAEEINVNAAAYRLYYWQGRGLLSRDLVTSSNPSPSGRGRPCLVYYLTNAGRRELALIHGARPDQYDASSALAAALGYRVTTL